MNLKKFSFYIILILAFIILAIPTYFLRLDNIFYMLYQLNYSNINSAILTIYGVLFAFIFAIMAILFSLDENSFFVRLIRENENKKQDVINYFVVSLISISIVLILSFFLTITYIGNYTTINQELISFLASISFFNNFLIYSLVYLLELSIISITLLLIMFIVIIKR